MKPENEEQAATSGETTAAAAAATAVVSVSASSASRNNGRSRTPSSFIGRHRLQAAISHLDQQIRLIQVSLLFHFAQLIFY